jgi:hypothetical protein
MNQLASISTPVLPALVAAAGERAVMRFLEFFAANIYNPHMRRAYARAADEFLAWCASNRRAVDRRCPAGARGDLDRQRCHDACRPARPRPDRAHGRSPASVRRSTWRWRMSTRRTAASGCGWAKGAASATRCHATVLPQANVYAMIRRRSAAADIATKLGNNSFRAPGSPPISRTAARSKKAATTTNHASTRTTQLYDRRRDEVSLDEVERIVI